MPPAAGFSPGGNLAFGSGARALFRQYAGSLYGYPGLQLLNAKKQPLPTRTLWGTSYFDRNQVKSLIVLSPGETASADISFGVYGTPSNSVLAYYLQVTPPNCYSHFT